MKKSSRVSAVVLGTAALLAVAVPAYAAWQITATNPQASAQATAVGPVTGVGSTVTSSSVTLTWTVPSGVAPTGYTVTRTAPTTAAVCTNAALPTCTDTGLSASTTYSYSVVALRSNWTSTAVTTNATTSASAALTVSTLTLTNGSGGTAGKIDNKVDSFTIGFSAPVRPTSICSTFSDSSVLSQTIGNGGATNGAFTLTIKDNAAVPVTTNDQITVSVSAAACGGTVNLGTLDLGSAAWTTTSRTYSGSGSNATSLTLNGTHDSLTVAIGNGTSTPTTGAVGSVTATFTPSSAIKDDATNLVPASGSKSVTGTQF